MAECDSKEIPEASRETLIPLGKAIFIIAGTAAAIMVIGIITGYNFFWNKYTLQTPDDAALQTSLQAIEKNPANAAAYLQLGYAYWVRGETEQAVQYYQKAYSLNPENRQVRYNLALGCMAMDKCNDAIKLLKPLAEEGILDFDAHFTLGTAYLKASQYNESIKAFEEALAIRGEAADAYYYIGQAYEGLGDRVKALNGYEKALRFIPNYPEALKARARLTGNIGGGDENAS